MIWLTCILNLVWAHDVYELLAEQKEFVADLNGLKEAVDQLEMDKMATDLDFKFIEKDIKNLSDELVRMTSSLGVIDNTLAQTSQRKLGLDKDTSDEIKKEVGDITELMMQLDEKIKKIETKQIDMKLNKAMNAPTQEQYLEKKMYTITQNYENVQETSGGSTDYMMYGLLGIIVVILGLTWWSFHRAETKSKLPSLIH